MRSPQSPRYGGTRPAPVLPAAPVLAEANAACASGTLRGGGKGVDQRPQTLLIGLNNVRNGQGKASEQGATAETAAAAAKLSQAEPWHYPLCQLPASGGK